MEMTFCEDCGGLTEEEKKLSLDDIYEYEIKIEELRGTIMAYAKMAAERKEEVDLLRSRLTKQIY